MSEAPTPILRLFFDADALLAGAASTRGAAHLLLRLGELGLVEIVTCAYVRAEVLRNMAAKLPRAEALLEALLQQAVAVLPDAEDTGAVPGVHPKDVPVWRAFEQSGAAYLITFNVRDYPAVRQVCPPGAVIAEIRAMLAGMSDTADR